MPQNVCVYVFAKIYICIINERVCASKSNQEPIDKAVYVSAHVSYT